MYLFNYLFGVFRRFQHCTGHITTGSWKGGGNQYIQFASGFCTVNCRPTASKYQLSHLRPCWEPNPGLRGGRQECYHSATVAPPCHKRKTSQIWQVHTLWRRLGYKGHTMMHTYTQLTNVPTKCQPSAPYGIQEISQTRFYRSRPLKGQIKVTS